MTSEERKEYKKKYYKDNYEKNKVKRKEYQKKYYQINKDALNIINNKYYKDNKEKSKELNKKWKARNPNYMKEYRVKHYKENKEKILLNNKEWKSNNPNYANEYYEKKYLTDHIFKLKMNLRGRTYFAFKNKGYIKKSKTEKILGASFEVVSKHIERQFTKDMTWDNKGDWHIDHIIPLASANTEEEVIKLCHYRNLQPLWAKDNLEKGCKIPNIQIQFKI
jgi:hypothetical protein